MTIPVPALTVVAYLTLALFGLAVINALAALNFRRISQRRATRQKAMRALWDPQIIRYLMGDVDADELHGMVAAGRRASFVGTLVRFARRIAGAEHEQVRLLAAPYLPDVELRYARRSAADRARAIQTLGELGWPAHSEAVVRALDDPSPLVAMVAARILCRPHSAEAGPEVVARLERFSTWTPMLLASMLANTGPEICGALRDALLDRSRSPMVRAAVAEALRQLNDFKAAETAAEVLEIESDREVVAAALRLLGRVGRSAHTGLVAKLLDSPDFVVRVAAADALAGLGGPNELQALRRVLTNDPSQWVALRAARSLLTAGWREELTDLAHSDHRRADVAEQVLTEASGR